MRRFPTGAVITALIAAFLLTINPATAATYSEPFPFPDPTSVDYTQIPIQETGVIDVVADGDTIRFIQDGTSDYVTVRLLGINTPEVRGFYNKHRNEDMCGAVEATNLLSALLPPGWPVQLRSLRKESVDSTDVFSAMPSPITQQPAPTTSTYRRHSPRPAWRCGSPWETKRRFPIRTP